MKTEFCQLLCSAGYLTFPSSEDVSYLIEGLPKSVPTPVFGCALIASGISFVRITNFGMKCKAQLFQSLDEKLVVCDAVNFGYPPNFFDLSYSIHVNHLFTLDVERYGLGGHLRIDKYPVFLPLHSQAEGVRAPGGCVTAIFTDRRPVRMVKFYNLLFHTLTACQHFQLMTIPRSKKCGRDRLNSFYSLLTRLQTNREDVGGFRIEVRIASKTFIEATQIYADANAFSIVGLLPTTTIHVKTVPVDRYLDLVEQKLRLADAILRRGGVSRHHGDGSQMMTIEQKRMYGDIKSLLFSYLLLQ